LKVQASTRNIDPSMEGNAMRARTGYAIGKRLCASVAAIVVGFAAGAASGQTIPVPVPDPPDRSVEAPPAQQVPKPAVVEPAKGVAPVKHEQASCTSFALRLRDGSRLIGVPSETKNLSFQSAFGRIEIPLALVKSVAFGPDPAGTAVGFHNGDRLTGAVVHERLRFQTAQGMVDVPMSTVIGFAVADETPKAKPPKSATPATGLPRNSPPRVAAPEAPLDAPR
jgi:hypothetical protein